MNTLLLYQKRPPNEPNSEKAPAGSILMACSQNGNVIQMLLFQSIYSRPHAQGERAGYSLIYILDPNYVFTPPETPRQMPPTASKHSQHCIWWLFAYVYITRPTRNTPARPALPSGTLGICTTLPAYSEDHITNPNQPRHPGHILFFWLVGNSGCGFMICFRQVWGFHIEI
jgi:hypothetical protein